MFDLSNILDLPLIYGGIIAIAIFLYVLLDGFVLGTGILFPFAPSDECRSRMMNSIAPFWDANQTWLVLGGGGLFVAFPLAYSILLTAFYIPVITMLLGLVVRGVALEFRFKSDKKRMWDWLFFIGSTIAVLCQGMILGAYVLGIKVDGRNFAGGPFDWLSIFSIMTGIALVTGYILLGSTWLIIKTADITQIWAKKCAIWSSILVGLFTLIVSCVMPFVDYRIMDVWFQIPNIYFLAPIPVLTFILFVALLYCLTNTELEKAPFILSMSIFLMAYIGLCVSIFPWIIPYHYDIWHAAAYGPSLSIVFVFVIPLLPMILGYIAYSYYVFRGKADKKSVY